MHRGTTIRTALRRTWWLGALATAGVALAHGDAAPKHGGILKEADDVHYELVVKPDSADLYIEDHGKPVATTGMRGKLTVLKGAVKTEAELAPAGGNRLTAAALKIGPGAKVIAAVKSADGKTSASLRYTIK